MDQQQKFEKAVTDSLKQHRDGLYQIRAQLDAVAKSLSPQAKGGAVPASPPLKEVLKAVSTALGEAAQIVEDHADGTVVISDGILGEAARTVQAARETLDAVILGQGHGGLLRLRRAA